MVGVKRKEMNILISRVDSDDLLNKDFIDQIQKQEYKERRILICDKGYVLFLDSPPILKRIKWKIGEMINKIIPFTRMGKR